MNPGFDNSTRAGIAGGTLLAIFVNIQYTDVLKTALLAAIGAVVSFCVTMCLKLLIKRIRKR